MRNETLIQACIRVIQDSMLTEEAFERKKALNDVSNHAFSLAEHMMLIQHCPYAQEQNHWKKEVNSFTAKIYKHSFLKKRARVPTSYLRETLWEEPLGEYDDYLRMHENLKDDKQTIAFKDPTPQDHAALKDRYSRLIDKLSDKKTFKYEDFH